MAVAADEDDKQLFREAVRDVRPIRAPARAAGARKPSARARFTRAERAAVLIDSLKAPTDDAGIETGEELSFHRPGVQDTVLRKLRRGQYRVEAEIDLHGLTLREARSELSAFLAECLARQVQCVRIVHGKGLRSGNRGPVLKGAVNRILQRTGPVIAFCSARRVDGGTGALYVLLSRMASALR